VVTHTVTDTAFKLLIGYSLPSVLWCHWLDVRKSLWNWFNLCGAGLSMLSWKRGC